MTDQQYHEPLDGDGIRMSHNQEDVTVPQMFPSREWCEAWCLAASEYEGCEEMIADLQGVWRIEIARDRCGPGATWYVEICQDAPHVRMLDEEETHRTRATVGTKYGVIKKIIEGEMDPTMAVLLRRIKISGDIGDLTSLRTRLKPLIATLQQVPTVYVC